MTGQPGSWYLDRLRAELERVAAVEDQRERRGPLRRLRLSWRLPAAVVAIASLVAIIVIVSATSSTRGEERTARPAPAVAPTTSPATDPDAILRRLDGLYVAEISAATLRRLDFDPGTTAGWWRIVIRSSERTLTLSAPEGPGSGDYTLKIASVGPATLTFAPTTVCPQREGSTASSVEFALSPTGVLTLRNRGAAAAPMGPDDIHHMVQELTWPSDTPVGHGRAWRGRTARSRPTAVRRGSGH